MSEFGLRIKSFQAGSVYECNNHSREQYDYKEAMITNSLFLTFITPKLEIKNGRTRDIISIDFQYGSRSYENEISHLESLLKNIDSEDISQNEKKDKKNKINYFLDKAKAHPEAFDRKTAQELRTIFYRDGVTITYKNKRGDTKDIRYRMLYRTPGKAKKGSCIFINEDIYPIARDFLYMGIKLPEHNSPIVEMGAYSSLITSTIVGTVKINPRNIFVVDDVDSYFETTVVNITTDKHKRCVATTEDHYKLKNTMFDGQALIDLSIFPEWGNGYILLRQHLCKMAAFATDIKQFFKDKFGADYETVKLTDRYGVEHYAKDIELITTENAMKWEKFKGVSYDYWCKKVEELNCEFGIVKTAHPSKLGDVQQMSYQMINSLDPNAMKGICADTLNYIRLLRTDLPTYLDYLRKNANFSNDFIPMLELVKQDSDFARSEYFKERRKSICRSYVTNFKTGKVIENGDNLVLVGSPYAMLLHVIGEDVENDSTLSPEEGCIQCYAERFEDGEYLAEFRNPLNSRNNIGYLHNKYSNEMKKYFRLGKLCIAVNVRHTDFEDRNKTLFS